MPCLRQTSPADIPAACSFSTLMICSSVNLLLRMSVSSKERTLPKTGGFYGEQVSLGPQKAIKRALEFRSRYDWCLKTDIQSFFDRIPRPYLKAKVSRFLKGSSLEPLICSVIDCEI